MITILKLIAAHIIGDFFLQSDWIAKNKRNSWTTLCLHSLINAAAVYVILGLWTLWWIPLIIFLSHLFIDYTKTHYGDDNVKWFIGDQIAHLSVLGLVWLLLTGDWSAVAASVQTALSSEKLWMYGIIYGLMTMPSSLLIERIFRPWMEKLPSYTGLEGAGKIIGYIERILIVTFVSTGNLSAVGFLITAKSVMRFSDIKSSSDFRMTEYILLGTMISFMIGIMGGLVLC